MGKTRKAKKVQQKTRAAKAQIKKSAKKAVRRNKKGLTAVEMAKSDDGGPPYKCRTTLEPGWCLKFTKDSKGRYNQPLGGTRVPCIECLYWFD